MPFPLPDYGYHSVFKKFCGIDLRQTSLCPNNCVMCAKAQKGHARDTMSWDDLHFVLELFPDFDGVVSILGTGEVFMLADLPQRVEAIKKAWPRCTLFTTTTFNIYRGDSWIEELFYAGLDTIKISCYGYNEEDYRKLHGYNGWNGLMKNLRAVGKLPPEYGAKLLMLSFKDTDRIFGIDGQAQKMAAFAEFAAENNIVNFQTNHVFPWHVTQKPNGKALWELPSPCTVVWAGDNPGWIYIQENLDVVPCCMFLEKDYVFGNLRQNSIDEIFNGEKYKYFQETWRSMQPEKLPVCNTCQVYETYASPRELARMAAWQARELAGKEVVFWGGGESYRAYRSFFSDVKPVAMLLDHKGARSELDGIPVYTPEEFLPTLNRPLPLVIFAAQDASPIILKKLREKFSYYKPASLVICPANACLRPEVPPYFSECACQK